MKIRLILNGKKIEAEIKADTLLLDLDREKGCYSVSVAAKLQTVDSARYGWMEKPVLSCSVLRPEPTDMRLQLWRAFRKSQRNLLIFWQEKARTSAASAVLVSL